MARVRTQCRAALPPNLARVNEAARRDKGARFTALLHHVNVESLERAYRRMKRCASGGVDGETVESYGQNLGENLKALWTRVHTGRYRPQPVRRVYIPKSGGGQRPLGIPAVEDKIVQGAVTEVLNAIYEEDFLNFSYGYRPGRSPRMALRSLREAVMGRKVNWVLDADIRRFFDTMDHGWMMRMLAHRIADRRVLRLMRRWLKAGVLEKGEWQETGEGTPQGACISPLLANLFLHHVLDIWLQGWRRRRARGEVVIVRYADDFIMGFQHEDDGRRMLEALKARLAKFNLELHEGKTRLIEFGRFAEASRRRRGQGRPETFAFLGLTHYCGETREGWFAVKVKTESRRLTQKLKMLRMETWRRMHTPVAMQRAWLTSVLRGHYAYYGLPGNHHALKAFSWQVRRIWFRRLKHRSQKCRMSWERFNALPTVYSLPRPKVTYAPNALVA
ncbi:MAG: group II intron reverse transcriptase/maturase [Chloroflexota bacterium]